MASVISNTNRKSYILSVDPVSRHPGANSLASPPQTPADAIRPPTPGGGPLTSHPSHPSTPIGDMPGAFPPTPEPEKQSVPKISTSTTNDNGQIRKDSFRTPISPASATYVSPTSATQTTASPATQPTFSPTTQTASSPEPQRKVRGVRKLLSLTNLRSSFSSSRTSLSLPRASNDYQSTTNSLKRPSSPSLASTTAGSTWSVRPQLREKKSSNWFKRKSGMFMMDADDNTLDAVDEDNRPDTRDSKRLKAEPAPSLPELGFFAAGTFDNGDLGWDEKQF